MSSSSLNDKTIRPGSLNGYYYYSDRRPQNAQATKSKAKKSKAAKAPRTAPRIKHKVWLVVILFLGVFGWSYLSHGKQDNQGSKPPVTNQAAAVTPAVAPKAKTQNCTGNTEEKAIKISISQRHLWACEAGKTAYNIPVITGLQHHPETETPLGTYKIYGKLTNTTLKGQDSRGAWSDPVYYWIPFLDNQYGTYGFHDATWRPDTAFGKVSPDSNDASHGCIELTLAASRWLYNWAPVGTTVTVES